MNTQRPRPHRWLKIGATLVFLFLASILTWDMWALMTHKPGLVRFPDEPGVKPFTATLQLTEIELDRGRRTGTAHLILTARAQDDQHPIETIVLGYRSRPSADERMVWLYFTYPGGGLHRFEEIDPTTGKFVDTAELSTEIEFEIDPLWSELWYPFDRHLLGLHLGACVNDENACLDNKNLLIESISVPVDPGLELSSKAGEHLSITFGRKRFIKSVTVILLALAVVFFFYLIRWSEAGELFGKSFGFLAGLWGIRQLIVPKSIEIFPTLVDYLVLLLFSGVFLLILTKTLSEKRPRETTT